jgi:hypothetical protein
LFKGYNQKYGRPRKFSFLFVVVVIIVMMMMMMMMMMMNGVGEVLKLKQKNVQSY